MEKKLFEQGKKYTTFDISSMMAMTSKREIQVVEVKENGDAIYKLKGKRKLFIIRLKSQSYVNAPIKEYAGAVFEGWEQPITCDTDAPGIPTATGMVCSTMRGNSCYNFMAMPLEIKAWIESGQLNDAFDKSKVVAIEGNKETVVYPEEYKGGHAVIDRLLAS